MDSTDTARPTVNKSTVRVIEVLGQFLDGRPHGVSEIGRSLGMTKSMVHRALATLLDERFVVRSPGSKKYMLGYGLLVLGSSVDRDPSVTELCGPYMRQISEDCGATVTLVVPVSDRAVTVDSVAPDRATVARTRIGASALMSDTAGGRALFAHLPSRGQDHVTQQLKARDVAQLQSEAAAIVEHGVARAWPTDAEDGEAVAVAVLDNSGVPHCAIGVAGRDMTDDRVEEIVGVFSASLPALRRRSTLLTSAAWPAGDRPFDRERR